jgi:hypothetical protein
MGQTDGLGHYLRLERAPARSAIPLIATELLLRGERKKGPEGDNPNI